MLYKNLQIARMSFAALLASRLRTALTMLGIVIGVASVILLTALGNGVQGRIAGQLGGLGTNTITVSPGSEGANDGPFGAAAASTLTTGDARAVAALPGVAAASPVVSVAAPVAGETVAFSGVDPSYTRIRAVELEAGRFLERPGEVVLAAETAQSALGASGQAAIGKSVEIRGEAYTVVGVAKAAAGGFGPPVPAGSYLATQDALALSGAATVGQILAAGADAESVDGAVARIGATLAARHGGAEDFYVETQRELLATFTQITDLLTYLLAGIAGISLLVAGIGIMNIMLVSVAERTREIGVRKALGATGGDVLLQFFLEAVLLAALGGLAGVALGGGVSWLLPRLSENLPTEVTVGSVGIALGVASLIGVVFGVLPAYRSARLQPVEALRRE